MDLVDYDLTDVWLGPEPSRIALVTDNEFQYQWRVNPDQMFAFSESEEAALWERTFDHFMSEARNLVWRTQLAFGTPPLWS